MEIIKKLLFTFFLFAALLLSNCCDDAPSCPGFKEEPILYLRNDSTQFRVLFINDKGIGDTTLIGNICKVPIDMNSNAMSYTFLAPEDKGILKLNYHVVMEKHNCECQERNLIILDNVMLDTSSTFTQVYIGSYNSSNRIRIDSSLADKNNYQGYSSYYYVKF